MITRIAAQEKTPLWRRLLDEAITDPKQLLRALDLDPELLPQIVGGHHQFKIKAPRSYLQRITKGDPNDPLLLQILPQAEETTLKPANYSSDPVGDLNASPVPGLIHKYTNRALLITSPACAIHCRYCFRREFPYRDAVTSGNHWQQTIEYLTEHSEISEVILSGGDPLTLPDEQLADLANQLAAIPHLKTLRIHTRLPIVLPERINERFLHWLQKLPLHAVVVIHTNHPNELNHQVGEALAAMSNVGITLYNQTVLLRNINDNAEILAELSHKLFEFRVQPYYLHVLDKVAGAAHFDIAIQQSRKIYQQLSSQLSGYLLPRLVQDLPDRPAKTIIV